MIERYFIYGLLGWCMEIFWTGFGNLFLHGDVKMRGQTYIWMFFIYGLGILIEPVHRKIRNRPVIVRGVIYTVLLFSIEYLTGSILKLCIGVCPWNYGKNPLSINGIIELDFIPIWFTVGLLFEKVHDYILKLQYYKVKEKQLKHIRVVDIIKNMKNYYITKEEKRKDRVKVYLRK